MGQEIVKISLLEQFQQRFEVVKKDLENLLTEYDVKNGVLIEVKEGVLRTFIDVGEFRKD